MIAHSAQWYFDGSLILSELVYTSVLTITASSTDGGDYSCTAVNTRGKNTVSHTVVIEGGLPMQNVQVFICGLSLSSFTGDFSLPERKYIFTTRHISLYSFFPSLPLYSGERVNT